VPPELARDAPRVREIVDSIQRCRARRSAVRTPGDPQASSHPIDEPVIADTAAGSVDATLHGISSATK